MRWRSRAASRSVVVPSSLVVPSSYGGEKSKEANQTSTRFDKSQLAGAGGAALRGTPAAAASSPIEQNNAGNDPRPGDHYLRSFATVPTIYPVRCIKRNETHHRIVKRNQRPSIRARHFR
jgi:hypothetical protein